MCFWLCVLKLRPVSLFLHMSDKTHRAEGLVAEDRCDLFKSGWVCLL